MRQTTTPREITPQIISLCQSLCAATPQYVPVEPQPNCRENDCFNNVDKYIQHHFGEKICGWAIWQKANIMIEAEAHAIIKTESGQLIDITPHDYSEKSILFLPDTSIEYTGVAIPNHRIALTDSPLVAEYIQLFNERDRLFQNARNGVCPMPKDLWQRIKSLDSQFNMSVTRNEPCPCGSGLKYKRCCGFYE